MSERVKVVVFVPEEDTTKVLQAMGDAGGGVLGDYTHCSYISKGHGHFLPGSGAHPAIGEVGKFETVAEDRIEMTVDRDKLDAVIKAMLSVHPYEEVAYDVYALEDVNR